MFALASCGKSETTPKQQLVAEAHQAVLEKLKDPQSATFKENDLEILPDQGVVCGKVNAKNGFGGYTGHQEYVYIRGQGATLIEDGSDEFIKAMNACAEALKIDRKRIEAETANTLERMDPTTKAAFERTMNVQ